MSKKGWIALGVGAVVVLWLWSTYNGLVNKDEEVNKAWANVETAYQRRFDLIPQLVETVKGAAKHEKDTHTQIVNARAQSTQTNVNLSVDVNLDSLANVLNSQAQNVDSLMQIVQAQVDRSSQEAMQKYMQAQQALMAGSKQLIATAEAYPDLKANENFLDLQKQLEGTENRISASRKDYNSAVEKYNKSVRRFPASLISGMFGFEVREMFKADEGAEKAVKVKFD